VHPTTGTLRVNSCGVLMLGSGLVQAIHADRVTFNQTVGYRFLAPDAEDPNVGVRGAGLSVSCLAAACGSKETPRARSATVPCSYFRRDPLAR
jgi:hypothetical protein